MTPSNNQAPLPPSDTPEQANKDTFKHAISYIPFVALVLFVVEKDKTPLLKKHISYGVILLFGYLITSTIVSIVGLPAGGLLGGIYILVSAYLGYMAYHGKNISIEQFDEIESQIKKNM